MNITRKVLIILGPTATGKTDLAIKLAKKFNGEIVACDSRQVYRDLDIGTGKLPSRGWMMEDGRWKKAKGFWEINGVKVWMYDVVNLKKQYTVADYVRDASRVIGEIRERGKLPIIVGGTGLYLKAILYGLSNLSVPFDKKLRKKLTKLSLKDLQEKLKKINFKKWQSMNKSDQQNPRRLVKAVELTMSKHEGDPSTPRLRRVAQDDKLRLEIVRSLSIVLKIGLTARREILYEKINKRVYEWIEDGIVDEVKSLIKNGIPKKRFKDLGLQYGVIIDYLDGELSYEDMLKKMQTKVRQYAKRQITWFKKEKDIHWFDITDKQFQQKIEKLVTQWYD